MGKTAIFGGTFNPPHLGHRAMLEWIVKSGEFDSVLVMPSNIPPHKSGKVVSAENRLAMCRLAFGDLDNIAFCEEELRMQGKSYTANTLKSLRQRGIINPTLLIGADSLVTFDEWFSYEEILKLAELIVYLREGIDLSAVYEAKEKLMLLGGKITVIDYTPPSISSTKVRSLLESGETASELVSPKVLKYIKENQLYSRD